MNVDKSGFPFVYEDFKKTLEGCDFYAVDQEMTGVNYENQHRSWTMSLPEIYEECRGVVNSYIAFQFGIAIFTRVKEGVYEVKPYNFYLFRRSGRFLVDGEAIAFLSSHKMDFQTWFLSGMSYCDSVEEKQLLAAKSKPLYSEVQEKIILSLVEKIDEWYHDSSKRNDESVVVNFVITREIEKGVLSILEERGINVFLQYQRKSLPYDFPTDILVSRVSHEKSVAKSKRKRGRSDHIFSEGLEFRLFWKCLTSCKKPIVGHHFWLDIMFMVHMHEIPLPVAYEAYKKQIHELFPCVYDTKMLSNVIVLEGLKKSPCLRELYKGCVKLNEDSSNSIAFYAPPGFHYYDERLTGIEGRAHEAGYDAYMTGVVFAIIKDVYRGSDPFWLKQWENIISVFGSYYAMNLSGNDCLRNGATFLLEFEEDMDTFLVWSLIATSKDMEDMEKTRQASSFDIKQAFKCGERGKTFVVQFTDETTSEDSIKNRIDSSAERLNNSLHSITGSLIAPKVKIIQRF